MARWWQWGHDEEEERARIRIATRAATTKAEALHWAAEIRGHLTRLEEALQGLPEDENDDE